MLGDGGGGGGGIKPKLQRRLVFFVIFVLDWIGWIPGRVETEEVVVLLVLRLSPQLTTEFLVINFMLKKWISMFAQMYNFAILQRRLLATFPNILIFIIISLPLKNPLFFTLFQIIKILIFSRKCAIFFTLRKHKFFDSTEDIRTFSVCKETADWVRRRRELIQTLR